MSKAVDQFEKFKAATLSSPSLSNAIKPDTSVAPVESKPTASPIPVSKPVAQTNTSIKTDKPVEEQVSFFIDKELKKAVGLLKYELGVQFKDLYEEAIRELLKKYNKL